MNLSPGDLIRAENKDGRVEMFVYLGLEKYSWREEEVFIQRVMDANGRIRVIDLDNGIWSYEVINNEEG